MKEDKETVEKESEKTIVEEKISKVTTSRNQSLYHEKEERNPREGFSIVGKGTEISVRHGY